MYNCCCTLVAVVDGVDTSNALRRDKDGLMPDMTFAQWEASKRGYSATPVSKIQNEPLKEWRNALQNKENRAILKSKIESGAISTKIRPQVQVRHIEGTPQFEEYKARCRAKGQTPQSVLKVAVEEAQKLVDKSNCTGIVEIQNGKEGAVKIAEYCDSDTVIGLYYGDNAYHDAKRFGIYYSKEGAHVVPTPPKGGK